jgi:CHAD domain-containing protein
MPYRFERGETVEEAFRRCAREQLDRATEELTEGVKTDPVVAVHDARKSLKKERSLLRLCRGSLTPAERREQNAALRVAASGLSGARDADAMIDALGELGERYAGQLPKRSWGAVRKHLEAGRGAARQQLTDSGAIAGVAQQLASVRQHSDEWVLRRGGWSALEPGLLRTYQRGGEAFKRVQRGPTVESIHDWRKRAKDLWYQLRLLGPISPRTINGHAQDAHALSDLLGDDHDLAVLRDSLIANGEQLPVDVGAVLALIDHRREQLQREAVFLGARLYAEKPRAFVRRIHRYWKASRAEDRAAESQRPAGVANRTRAAAA